MNTLTLSALPLVDAPSAVPASINFGTNQTGSFASMEGIQTWVVAQAEKSGPMGAEFGKAAPVGLFVIVALLLVVLLLGFAMNKRIRRMERRRAFADKHGIDLFDTETLERRMKEEGFDETAGRSAMFARTEVPVTDERFEPSSGTLTGPAAIDAERHARPHRDGDSSTERGDNATDLGGTPEDRR
ncbi:hypothetical protein [Corynebacterium sp. HMSC28B08]|uniref:hypothetical protein n=1 Tax=Corynebacterium TaxID=1716 RepID=UPI000A99753B|nr:hypothetical protein [Corynebacterium sp. HMSC28B08]